MADSSENLDRPIEELEDLAVEPSGSLENRVRNDINRRTLAANSLELSLTVMISTFWDHLYSLLDSWPGLQKPKEEDKNG